MACGKRLFVRCLNGDIVNGRRGVTEKECKLSTVVRRDNWREMSEMSAMDGTRDQRWFLIRISIATQIHLASSKVGSQAKRPSHKRSASGIPNSLVKRRRSQRLKE